MELFIFLKKSAFSQDDNISKMKLLPGNRKYERLNLNYCTYALYILFKTIHAL